MVTQIILFLLVLSILVLIHELGHFLAAIKSGVKVEEFGFGIPPRVWGKKIGETIYSINLLPFGGFVRLHGETSEDEVIDPKRSFLNKGKLTRISIVIAGVVMNFLLAVFLFSITYSFTGVPRETGEVKVLEVAEESPAAYAGISKDDVLLEIDNQPVYTNAEFIKTMQSKKGSEIDLKVKKPSGEIVTIENVMARANPPENEGPLGVLINSAENYFPPIWQMPFYGIYYGVKEAVFWGMVVVFGFGKMISELFLGIVPRDITGPVGIYALTSQAANYGVLAFVNFIAILSVNLAILNIMPFPALDGGRLLFILIESVFGKKFLPKIESIAHTVGMALLLTLLFAITAYDIQRLISAGSIEQFFQDISQSR
ncbi:MAG: M50 family metallopeptidase [Patescibacteria group bacterium]|nr:M50 family metallopeptidase [Patescibacteria group bacterium]